PIDFGLVDAADDFPHLAAAAKGHRTQTELGDEHTGVSKKSIFHTLIIPSHQTHPPSSVVIEGLVRLRRRLGHECSGPVCLRHKERASSELDCLRWARALEHASRSCAAELSAVSHPSGPSWRSSRRKR